MFEEYLGEFRINCIKHRIMHKLTKMAENELLYLIE